MTDGETTKGDTTVASGSNGGPADEAGSIVESVGAGMEGAVERFFGGLSASSVFGAPERVGERLVIPAAAIQRAGGFGFGAGADPRSDAGPAGGGGGGGGGAAEGRPVAVIDVAPDGVRVRPVLDVTRIGIALLVATAVVWASAVASHAPRRRGRARRAGRRATGARR